MPRELIATFAGVLALLSAAPRCQGREPFENQWGPFTGTVVDEAAGQPIPAAVFTVNWIEEIPFIGHSAEQFFDARVAVADEQGHFEIPRRSAPWFFPARVKPPNLSCIDPEHAPFQDVGAQNAPIAVKLRRLSSPEEIRLGLFSAAQLSLIPDDKRPELEEAINATRKRIGLRPIKFPWGGYRKE